MPPKRTQKNLLRVVEPVVKVLPKLKPKVCDDCYSVKHSASSHICLAPPDNVSDTSTAASTASGSSHIRTAAGVGGTIVALDSDGKKTSKKDKTAKKIKSTKKDLIAKIKKTPDSKKVLPFLNNLKFGSSAAASPKGNASGKKKDPAYSKLKVATVGGGDKHVCWFLRSCGSHNSYAERFFSTSCWEQHQWAADLNFEKRAGAFAIHNNPVRNSMGYDV